MTGRRFDFGEGARVAAQVLGLFVVVVAIGGGVAALLIFGLNRIGGPATLAVALGFVLLAAFLAGSRAAGGKS